MAPKQTCGAHLELTENIKHLRAGQDKLFDLDREKADSLSTIRESVARIEERSNAGFISITNQLHEYEGQQAAMSETFKNGMAELMKEIQKRPPVRKRWTSKAVIALLSVLVGPAGVSALFNIFKK